MLGAIFVVSERKDEEVILNDRSQDLLPVLSYQILSFRKISLNKADANNAK